jgi:hypothetical protein
MKAELILKRASTSRPSGEWNDDDYDVLADGAVVGRIMKAAAVPVGMSWMWTLAFGHHEDRTPTHGYAATREAAMAASAVDCTAAQAVAAALMASAMGNIVMASGPRPRLRNNANSAHC